jgi:tetratricopeptide (TPR) repeat protein
MAGVRLVRGDAHETIAWVDRAVSLAAELGVDVPARAIGFRGYARCSLGDAQGLDEMRAALGLAVERGESRDAAVLYNNLAVGVLAIEGPRGVLSVAREGIEFSERRGIREIAMSMAAGNLDQLIDTGEWDAALEQAESIAGRAEASGDVASLLQARWALTRLLALRGEMARAAELADWLVPAARESGGVEDIIAGFTSASLAYLGDGRPAEALELLVEIGSMPHNLDSPTYPAFLCSMVRTAVAAGDVEVASRLASGLEPIFPYHEHALVAVRATLAEARHDFDQALEGHAEAGSRWERFGLVPERGHALLGLGRCLLEVGRRGEAAEPLQEARAVFAHLGAAPILAETNALLEANGRR